MKEKAKMILINCTPHKISIQAKNGLIYQVEPDKNNLLRLENIQTNIGSITTENNLEFNLYYTKTGEALKIPPKIDNRLYIVSSAVREYMKKKGRDDFVSPAKIARDNYGNIIAAEGLTF